MERVSRGITVCPLCESHETGCLISRSYSPPQLIFKRERVKPRFFASSFPNPLHNSTKMPPLHTPLRNISGNRLAHNRLTPYMRGQVVGQAFKGIKNAQIAKDLNLSDSTVRYTLQQDELRANGESLSRKPRGKSYIDVEDRLLIRHVRLNPKDTY